MSGCIYIRMFIILFSSIRLCRPGHRFHHLLCRLPLRASHPTVVYFTQTTAVVCSGAFYIRALFFFKWNSKLVLPKTNMSSPNFDNSENIEKPFVYTQRIKCADHIPKISSVSADEEQYDDFDKTELGFKHYDITFYGLMGDTFEKRLNYVKSVHLAVDNMLDALRQMRNRCEVDCDIIIQFVKNVDNLHKNIMENVEDPKFLFAARRLEVFRRGINIQLFDNVGGHFISIDDYNVINSVVKLVMYVRTYIEKWHSCSYGIDNISCDLKFPENVTFGMLNWCDSEFNTTVSTMRRLVKSSIFKEPDVYDSAQRAYEYLTSKKLEPYSIQGAEKLIDMLDDAYAKWKTNITPTPTK